MGKTDKELAVEFAIAYVTTWFSREGPLCPMSGDMIQSLISEPYNAIHNLPND